MEKVVAVFPVMPGKNARDVAKVLKGREAEYAESRKRQGVHMERAYEQQTPMGPFVVAYIESDGSFLEANAAMATSDLPIDREFMNAIKEVHGFDATQPPPFDPPEVLGDWADPDWTMLDGGLIAPPQLPIQHFGRWAPWLELFARAASSPVDFAAAGLLAVAAATTGAASRNTRSTSVGSSSKFAVRSPSTTVVPVSRAICPWSW